MKQLLQRRKERQVQVCYRGENQVGWSHAVNKVLLLQSVKLNGGIKLAAEILEVKTKEAPQMLLNLQGRMKEVGSKESEDAGED